MPDRRHIPKGILRDALARNLRILMKLNPALGGDKYASLAERSGLSKSSIGRILAGETGATLDSVEALARALEVSPSKLLESHTQEKGDINPEMLGHFLAKFSKLSKKDQEMFLRLITGYESHGE